MHKLMGLIVCLFIFQTLLLAQPRIVDPEEGGYVSGEYRISLAYDNPVAVSRTRIVLNGQEIHNASGWTPLVTHDFGPQILRHELYVILELKDGSSKTSPIITTRELEIDYVDESRLVLLGAVVKTRGNRPIAGLTKDRFTVLENGRPVEIKTFYKEKLPLDLVVMLDTSSSLRQGGVDDLRRAAISFTKNLEPADRVSLYEFKKAPHKLLDFTTDRTRLAEAIANLKPVGETALFNALHMGLNDLKDRGKGRKALLLFTDGRDSYYDDPRDKARVMRSGITKAQNQEVTIFTLGLGRKIHKEALKRMATETGGRFYYADKPARLNETFAEIISDLKNQYMLGVAPEATGGGFQSIEVKVRRRGAVVYARKGYTL